MNRPLTQYAVLVFATSLGLGAAAADAQTAVDRAGPVPEVVIIGNPEDVLSTAGSAHVISEQKLEQFNYADIQRIMRAVPGVSVQVEDGFGLRPNLSIRGTATERSGRITLLEDNVLIAPAPYSAPSAYYFPTAGRMRQVEILKGSAAVKQGPYTVGGAINFLSTAIPAERSGFAELEFGSYNSQRLHAGYGDAGENVAWLVEGHLWQSDGFQDIDLAGGDTGLKKDDWMGKLRFSSDADAHVYQQLDIKLQFANEASDQSYLGLTDGDFAAAPYRRYAVSQLDNIDTAHEQYIVSYLARFRNDLQITATGYLNTHERDWFKTEGLDFDGSNTAEEFSHTSWFSVVQAVNRGEGLGSATAADLRAVLNGGDTAPGSLQVRSNAREYFSRGIQLGFDWQWSTGSIEHGFEAGVRYHEDEEDRLQRNSNYHLEDGAMVLDDLGLMGNAGNRVQKARAVSAFIYDRIAIGDLLLTPGLRYEDIRQSRIRWEIRAGQTDDPSSRAAANIRDERQNDTQVLIPGFGALYALNDRYTVYGGVHRGFTAPSNAPDVDEEKSINYELGMRFAGQRLFVDGAVFFTDYDNLLGECTSSSGADCEVGDAFNGDAATITGLELLADYNLSPTPAFALPVSLSYTYIDARFDSDIADTDFFGDVSVGDPLPYIPENQFLLSLGLERNAWSAHLNANYVDAICVRASCGQFERTDDTFVLDLAAHWRLSDNVTVYGKVDNLTAEEAIVGRQPYGARPNMDRLFALGVHLTL